MKEKAEIKRLSDKLDALRRKEAGLLLQEIDSVATHALDENRAEQEKLNAEIERLRAVQASHFSAKAQQLLKMPFSREITKKEQADMGSLKKAVRGIEVVHPMTALGREMGLKVVTGYAKKEF
ncbi:YibL family ribosome-associated protein [Hafnia alvei]|uniref:Ribosome-associated protein n=1 Tax=Hafnia alvei TaxID=569 RepID=A0A1C6YZ38_HAFAL|nr:YibL family ribosome-associated protein [Hafnia alvei]NLS53621.1 YibL family ribosome-associated protein [Hafnia alvei]SCM52025.1 ribosome-associated protein [Hafnia alvei]